MGWPSSEDCDVWNCPYEKLTAEHKRQVQEHYLEISSIDKIAMMNWSHVRRVGRRRQEAGGWYGRYVVRIPIQSTSLFKTMSEVADHVFGVL